MKQWKIFLALFIVLIVTIFIVQNTDVVSYRFLLWELTLSRVIVIPLFFLAGVVFGFIMGWMSRSNR